MGCGPGRYTGATLSEELAVALYEQMVLARTLATAIETTRADRSVGMRSSSFGEEATVIGAMAALNDDDWVFPGSRELLALSWRGVSLAAQACRAFGTMYQPPKGEGVRTTHLSAGVRVVAASPLCGAQIPHAVGLAWAARLRGADVAALVVFGEDAANRGDFHTGLNFAGVACAPVIAVRCVRETAAGGPPRGDVGFASLAYGIFGITVDGGDAVAVLQSVREARRRAASGLGGTLVEAVLPRPGAADASDPSGDPLVRMRQWLESRSIWSQEREDALRRDVDTDVTRAVAEAATGAPAPPSFFDHVYAELPWHLQEQRRS